MRFSKIVNLLNAPAIHNQKIVVRTFQIPPAAAHRAHTRVPQPALWFFPDTSSRYDFSRPQAVLWLFSISGRVVIFSRHELVLWPFLTPGRVVTFLDLRQRCDFSRPKGVGTRSLVYIKTVKKTEIGYLNFHSAALSPNGVPLPLVGSRV